MYNILYIQQQQYCCTSGLVYRCGVFFFFVSCVATNHQPHRWMIRPVTCLSTHTHLMLPPPPQEHKKTRTLQLASEQNVGGLIASSSVAFVEMSEKKLKMSNMYICIPPQKVSKWVNGWSGPDILCFFYVLVCFVARDITKIKLLQNAIRHPALWYEQPTSAPLLLRRVFDTWPHDHHQQANKRKLVCVMFSTTRVFRSSRE